MLQALLLVLALLAVSVQGSGVPGLFERGLQSKGKYSYTLHVCFWLNQ